MVVGSTSNIQMNKDVKMLTCIFKLLIIFSRLSISAKASGLRFVGSLLCTSISLLVMGFNLSDFPTLPEPLVLAF